MYHQLKADKRDLPARNRKTLLVKCATILKKEKTQKRLAWHRRNSGNDPLLSPTLQCEDYPGDPQVHLQ
jgi:hypothetical protein